MKLIIDISEATQKIIHDHGEVGIHMSAEKLLEAIQDSTPLDKIRAKLHATAEMHCDGGYYLRDEWVDEIFDKYKAESEDKE